MAQTGGTETFQFLNFTNSARVESTGGYLLTIKDDDATLGQENPALLNRSMHGLVNLNYVNYFANSNYGYTSYTHHFSDIGTFNAALLYANYGKFEYADVNGDRSGATFSANDLVLKISYGRPIDSLWSVGAAINTAASFYESYNAFGSSMDFGINYFKQSSQFGAALLVKNAGIQWNGYTDNNREKLPLNIVAQVSKKLKHAPIRLSLAYENIQKWNLIYFDDTQTFQTDPLTGEITELKPPGFGKKLMYHLVLGGELLFSKNFHVRFGYNHAQRQFLKVGAKPGMTGFSFGFGLKIKSFQLSYALSKYHIAGTSNQITLSKRFGKMPTEDTFYRQFK